MSHHHHHHARGITALGASRKRKETESGFLCYSQYKPVMTVQSAAYTARRPPVKSEYSNWLLAGYLAHEFLTNGTLLGHELNKPVRPDIMAGPEADLGRKKAHNSYADVASVLKIDGTHVPGVVNPTQLAKWIQM